MTIKKITSITTKITIIIIITITTTTTTTVWDWLDTYAQKIWGEALEFLKHLSVEWLLLLLFCCCYYYVIVIILLLLSLLLLLFQQVGVNEGAISLDSTPFGGGKL